jgi:hypothetical protein
VTEKLPEEGSARMLSIPHFFEMDSRPVLRIGADLDDKMRWDRIL